MVAASFCEKEHWEESWVFLSLPLLLQAAMSSGDFHEHFGFRAPLWGCSPLSVGGSHLLAHGVN